MKKRKKCRSGEEGFVLVASLLILLVLTLLGIAVNQNTDIEWRIAMNDRLHKETFYSADAATELASESLEQSVACLGFRANTTDTANPANSVMRMVGAPGFDLAIEGNSLGFWRNYAPNGIAIPSDTNRNLVFPAVFTAPAPSGLFDPVATNNQPHSNINIGGNTKLTEGSALQMAAGYEGVGKGMGSGGATLVYDINVQHVGRDGSESVICIQYGHVLGSSGACNYP
ncbi:MAG: PilX N-terminal [Candidatus Electronema aureum]|uniref:PilX N-terminal n=1 Tax=Candidatus Electronema aureum TaxID=2005002 RepID=A0A521G322_9BACT|nr:MAG: PilX N-terminal [Candidatus Electronema aureum]